MAILKSKRWRSEGPDTGFQMLPGQILKCSHALPVLVWAPPEAEPETRAWFTWEEIPGSSGDGEAGEEDQEGGKVSPTGWHQSDCCGRQGLSSAGTSGRMPPRIFHPKDEKLAFVY